MRIIGLDPGLRNTGWGIIEVDGNCIQYVDHGVIKPSINKSLPERLTQLYSNLTELIATHRPDEAAVEEIFVNKNAASALKLGEARGVVLVAPANAQIPISEYSANHIKKSVVGNGHADKAQVIAMVKHLLPMCGELTHDAADALAVAICHTHHYATRKLWERRILV